MTPRAFGMFDAYKFGLRTLAKNFLLVLGVGAILGITVTAVLLIIHLWVVPLEWHWTRMAQITSTSFNFEFKYILEPAQPIVITPLQAIAALVALFVMAFVGILSKMFFARIGLDAYERSVSSFESLKAALSHLGTYFLAVVLIYMIVGFGFVLLIVPGFIFWMKYGFGDLIALDTDLGPVEAIKRSGEITYGYKWRLFGFYFLSAILASLSSILVLVGPAIFALSFIFARVYIYRKLVETFDKNKAQFTAVPPNM